MSDKLDNLYQDYWSMHASKVNEGHDPLALAGVLVAQAMTIYKTVLDQDGFDRMVDNISESRDRVRKLTTGITLQ